MTNELFAFIVTAAGTMACALGDGSPPTLGGKVIAAAGLGGLAYAATGIARTLLGALS
jgi:hypothetical protein